MNSTIYISNKNEDFQRISSERDGSILKPMIDLSNGIKKGMEQLAPYTTGVITVFLFKGDHYLLANYSHYIPINLDTHSNNYDLIIR